MQGPERRQQYLDLQQENRQLAAVTADLERQLADMNGTLAAMEKVGHREGGLLFLFAIVVLAVI